MTLKILVLYVDDMLITKKSTNVSNRLKARMVRIFDRNYLGEDKQSFGIEIHKD